MSFKQAIQPFKPKPVRLLLLGDLFFFLSFWVVQINLSWVMYKVDKSPLQLGLLGFLVNLPMICVLPFAGILADRYNRRRIILLVQLLWLVPTAILVAYGSLGKIHMALIFSVGIIYGCLFAILKPASDALIRDVVATKEDIPRVTGIDGAINKVMQFFGGVVSSIMHILSANVGAFFASLCLTVLAYFSFFRIKVPHKFIPETDKKPMQQMAEGFQYVFHRLKIWSTTLLSALALGIIIALLFQLPIFAGTVLKGNINYLHYFYYAAGIGGTTGGVVLAMQIHNKNLLGLATAAMVLMGAALIVFAFSRNIILSAFSMLVSDGSMIFIFASCSASIQLWIEDSKRGRVMSIYSLLCIGTIPFANIIMGVVAEYTSITATVAGAGILCIIAAIIYWQIRRRRGF